MNEKNLQRTSLQKSLLMQRQTTEKMSIKRISENYLYLEYIRNSQMLVIE